MDSKNRVFSLLGGIFLMASGFFLLVTTTTNMARSAAAAADFGNIIALNIDLLFLLCGLFLLLRKPRVAASMMCAICGLYVLNVALHIVIRSSSYNWFTTICIFLAYALFAAGMFGKGVYALIMCLAAAFFRFMPFITQLIGFPHLIKYSNALLLINNISSLFGSMLLIAAMVRAGLYLFSLRKKA